MQDETQSAQEVLGSTGILPVPPSVPPGARDKAIYFTQAGSNTRCRSHGLQRVDNLQAAGQYSPAGRRPGPAGCGVLPINTIPKLI